MAELVGGLVTALVVGTAVVLMWRSWRRRSRRDTAFGTSPLPAGLGAPVLDIEALYVATTPVGSPLERLAIAGLAFRGAAHVEVHPEGVLLRISGEQPSFIAASALAGAGTATYAIDRGVEPEGLVAISWRPEASAPSAAGAPAGEPPIQVDSYLRARYPGDAARLIAAVTDLAAAVSAPRPEVKERDTND
ncbi:PH-like domain-containing protein [Agromyces aerolatus]|uniref:PH-like domain-containing protein n=1 Tax=Agromyces sp. LY-1074 TaxID=3074080 RepID=UPI0028579092|nr:hypothetical protein [Agromyces sp. LY-1358]MDR5707150.1 hypothetical protein [Agromyces sp. LY-1358]